MGSRACPVCHSKNLLSKTINSGDYKRFVIERGVPKSFEVTVYECQFCKKVLKWSQLIKTSKKREKKRKKKN